MTAVRERTVDRNGKVLVPGMKVKIVGESGQPEGTVLRVLDDYQTLTVVVPEGRGQAERMYRVADVEAV